MSTKIFNAYRIHGVRNFDSLNNFLEELSGKVDQILFEEFNKIISREMVLTFDRKIVQPDKKTEHDDGLAKWGYLSHFIDYAEQKKSEASKSMMRNPFYDFDVHIPFFFYSDFVYCIIFSEQRRIHEMFKDIPTVEDYSYFNNTDKPDDVSEKDWDERALVWNKIMPTSVPSTKGLQLSRTNPFIGWSNCLIIENAPDFEERVLISSERVVMDNNLELIIGKNGKFDWSKYSKFRKSDEFKQELEKVKKLVRKKLPENLEIKFFSNSD